MSPCAGDLITLVTLTFTTAGVTFSAREEKLGSSGIFWIGSAKARLNMSKRFKKINILLCILNFFFLF